MMVRLPRKRLMGLGLLTGMMVLLVVLVAATLAFAAFSLEYAPGVEHGKGIVGNPAPRAAYVAVGGAQPLYPLPPAPKPRIIPRAPTPSTTIPASIVNCESGGSYTAENPVSSASGKYQIIDSTWGGYGGYSHASDAPPHVQDKKAAELWNGGKGSHHWRQCGG